MLKKLLKTNLFIFLCVVFLTNNMMLYAQDDIDEDIISMDDMTISEEDMTTLEEDITENIEDLTISEEDMTTYDEDMLISMEESTLFEFCEYIDDVYVINYRTQDYINSHIIVDDEITLDIEKIVTDLSIGAGVTTLVAIISIPMTGGTSCIIPAIISVSKKALLGAAGDAAVRGVIEAVKTGDIDSISKQVLEGAAEGYKWGAIFASAHHLKKLNSVRKSTKKLKNVRIKKKYVKSRKVITYKKGTNHNDRYSRDELMAIKDYTSEEGPNCYKSVNSALRSKNNIKNNKTIELLDSAMKKNRSKLKETTDLYRGQTNLPSNLKNYKDINGNIDPKKLIGQTTEDLGFTSTSKTIDTAAQFASIGKEKIIRKIRVPKGTNVIDIDEIGASYYKGEKEVLLNRGLKTEVVDAYYTSDGIIHLIEEVIF